MMQKKQKVKKIEETEKMEITREKEKTEIGNFFALRGYYT